jgi:hypothetical protein
MILRCFQPARFSRDILDGARFRPVTTFLTAFRVVFACLLASIGLSQIAAGGEQAQFDGPAELPRAYVNSALSATPSPGKTIPVHAGDNLQAAVDSASCGDRIELQAGAVFSGIFRFPDKPCDDAHWITIRTGAADSRLPAEGTRLKPCFAGVASLPGRPDFRCPATENVMAKLEFNKNSGVGPLIFLSGANHYRFIGLEVTRSAGNGIDYALATADEGAQTNHLIFDRVWMHGTPQDEAARAIAMVGMSYVAVIDSFFTDFHCVAVTGACTDAQVLSNGGGRTPSGPFKIANNFLESSGENILFGGGGATMTPADIEIRGNYFFKPLTWKLGEPGFVPGASGRPFIVKNLFELKNAQRVLFEGNVLENCWGGFSQNGYAILLTPKNQSGHCPLCRVTDVTIRYNLISNVGAVLAIANVADDPGAYATAGERYSIHDLVVESVRGKDYQGAGLFLQLISLSPALRNVKISHSIAFAPRAAFAMMNISGLFDGFEITDNILSTGQSSIVSSGGGTRNCAERVGLDPGEVFKSCFDHSSFTHNLMIGEGGWPKGNITQKDVRAAGILDSHDNVAFKLCTTADQDQCKKLSPALHAGTDGKNLGPDFELLGRMLTNVR